MSKVILVTDNNKTVEEVEKLFVQNSMEYEVLSDAKKTAEAVRNSNSGIFLFDCDSKELDIISILRKLKLVMQTKDMRSVLLLSEDCKDYDILQYSNAYITRPIEEQLFVATINANNRLCDTFRMLSKNNNDLAKSLYQLNVLYNTSSQLAGSLDKTRLIDIMTEGLDQSLALSLSYALILNEANDIKLIIKSALPISVRLERAIKLRALINYKNLFSINPSIDDIEVVKTTKDRFGEYDLNIFGYDNLFAPINIKNKFYGIIEVFRESDFTQEDTKCFTTLVKQVSLPLESAILYEEIKVTNEKLARLEKLKSDFVSIVSHELRTPLTSINSALEIILKGSTGEINQTTEKFLNLAKRNVTRLSAIICDLLDISKIEAGKMSFKFEKSNINIPVELVKNALDSVAAEQKITITTDLDKSLDLVFIDTQRIEQVITNLISNAIKFTGENGTIKVKSEKISNEELYNNPFFETKPENLSKEYVKISVSDNGIGIAPENWSKVFEQFKQIENSSTRKVGGSGLGLPIAKRLIDAHKGFIWLESELNKGTTFFVALPIMSEKEIFLHSLEQDMQRAKQEKLNISLVSLSEKITEDSAIEKLLNDNIIRKTKVFKEYFNEESDRRYYYSYSLDVESYVYDFEIRKLDTYIKELNKENDKYDIMYSTLLYPQDEEDKTKIMEELNNFTKGE